MNYYELIYLKKELKHKLSNCVLEQSITPYKNLLELYIVGEDKSFRLVFSCAPGNMALFPDTYRPAKKSNALQFFEPVYGECISDIVLAENDRLIALEFENGSRIWFKLFSNKANALLVEDGVITETFKDHGEKGNEEPEPKSQELFGEVKGNNPKQIMLKANPLLPRSNLDIIIELNGLKDKSPEEIFDFTKELTSELMDSPEPRRLTNRDITMLSTQFYPVETEKEFESVGDMISYRYKNYSHEQRLKQQKGEFRKTIKRQVKRLDSALRNLNKADKGIEKADRYEKLGHILMANAHVDAGKQSKIEVDDLYNQGEKVKIKIDPELSIAENAEYYYDRASSSVRSYEEALKRIPKIEERQKRLEKMQIELQEISHLRDLDDWKKKYKKELENLGFGKKKQEQTTQPFHTLELKGHQIWIGKNAKSNDKIVQQSHKEDVWLHARGVPGSHVVIRMANNKNMPEKALIEEVASYAAFNSKAKGSNLVPVIFTKRKYVRKPKGAAPGAVLVQKEEVELVSPKKPEL